MSESLQTRIHGDAALPQLIYLPGLHGDWLLVTRFRLAVAGRVRFVEFTYPNTTTWSLDDFAAAVAEKLREHGIVSGWVLAESFGSQVAWELMRAKEFQTEGLILAGGFVKHPWPAAAPVTEWLLRRAPLAWLTAVVSVYAVVARWRFKQHPEVMAALREFQGRWDEPLRQAAAHRLRLIAGNDPRPLARAVTTPVFQLTGVLDPVVLWPPVRRWLRRECPGWRANHVVWTADHNVLGTGTAKAAEQVLRWMGADAASRRSQD
jgi:pimeloyl-ACP methyl ester carboxylesterase